MDNLGVFEIHLIIHNIYKICPSLLLSTKHFLTLPPIKSETPALLVGFIRVNEMKFFCVISFVYIDVSSEMRSGVGCCETRSLVCFTVKVGHGWFGFQNYILTNKSD